MACAYMKPHKWDTIPLSSAPPRFFCMVTISNSRYFVNGSFARWKKPPCKIAHVGHSLRKQPLPSDQHEQRQRSRARDPTRARLYTLDLWRWSATLGGAATASRNHRPTAAARSKARDPTRARHSRRGASRRAAPQPQPTQPHRQAAQGERSNRARARAATAAPTAARTTTAPQPRN